MKGNIFKFKPLGSVFISSFIMNFQLVTNMNLNVAQNLLMVKLRSTVLKFFL